MIKRIIIMLFFTIAIIPAIYNMAFAQSYGSETVDLPGGVKENWELISPNDEHWVLVEVYDPVNGTGNGTNDQIWDKDPENPLDPVNNEDWGYPDWADIIDWLDFLNESQDRYSFENVRGSDSTVRKYYIIVDNKQEKYYNNSKFNFPKKDRSRAKFTIDEISSSISEAGLRWKINGIVKTNFNNRKTMWLPLDTKATYSIEVWEESIRKYIQFTVSVFGSPTVFFHRKDDYKGEYGFDAVGHLYDSLKNDYQKILIDSQNYNVPWLSVLDGQTATVKITSTITAAAASDTTIKVTFKPSHNRIKINGLDELQNISLSTLQTMNSIQITATEWDTAKIKSYSKEGIWVISNGGDTIGKLSIVAKNHYKKE